MNGRRMSWIWPVSVVLLIVLTGHLLLASVYRAPLALTTPEYLLVEPGDHLVSISVKLRQADIFSRPDWLIRLADKLLADTKPIIAGEYQLTPGLTLEALLTKLRAGAVHSRYVTFPEGLTLRQWREKLYRQQGLQLVTRDWPEAEIARRIRGDELSIEGWLYPETYQYQRGHTDLSILSRAHQAMKQIARQAWQSNPQPTLDNLEEALILASIVERESGRPGDQRKIAQVFLNRLRQGMRLQSDPTIIYGLGEAFKGDLTRAHLKQDGPYNSYRRFGLPPTAICNPGLGALRAVLDPAQGDWLYFIGRGDGSSVFSLNLKDHQKLVDQYLK